MSDNKRYWLKMKENFYDEDEMVYLRTQKNGFEYIYLWNRLLLKCLKSDTESECGFLRVNDKMPYSPNLFSQLFGLNKDVIEKGIELFIKMGMLEILEDGTIYIESVQRMIGKESDSAERVRLHREKKKRKALQCNNGVTECNDNKEKERRVKVKIDKELEKEKELSQEIIDITQYLYDSIPNKPTKWNKKPPDLMKWYRDVDLLNRVDGISLTDIRLTIDWIFKKDKWKWKSIIQSASGLRKNYNSIEAQMPIEKDRKSWEEIGIEVNDVIRGLKNE